MKSNKEILLGVLLLLSTLLSAQEPPKHPNVDEMRAQKWKFLVEESQLTPKEVEAVLPVFTDYEKTMWEFHQQNREFFRNFKKANAAAKPSYAEMNDRYVESELKQAQLFKNYHLQLRKILQPEVLFKYYKAEREFKRKLLQDMQAHKQQGFKPEGK